MSIYKDVQKYAKHCHISLELATKRCGYFLKSMELAEKVVCPNCGSHKLSFDNAGGDYPSEDFISCT